MTETEGRGRSLTLVSQVKSTRRFEFISGLDKAGVMSLSPRSSLENARVVELVDTHV